MWPPWYAQTDFVCWLPRMRLWRATPGRLHLTLRHDSVLTYSTCCLDRECLGACIAVPIMILGSSYLLLYMKGDLIGDLRSIAPADPEVVTGAAH